MNAETYVGERLQPQLSWPGQSSRSDKAAFLHERRLNSSLGGPITILAPQAATNLRQQGLAAIPVPLQVSGTGVGLCGAMLDRNRHQENWLHYCSLKGSLEWEY